MLCSFPGIYEADGNERESVLGSLVSQVFRLHGHFRGNYGIRFPHRYWRQPGNYHLRRPERHAGVSAAVCHISDDLLLRHLNFLFNRFDFCCVTDTNPLAK